MSDATLDGIADRARAVERDIIALYDSIRAAKANGYSYNELESATGLVRGTIQNIVAGKNPRYSLE